MGAVNEPRRVLVVGAKDDDPAWLHGVPRQVVGDVATTLVPDVEGWLQ